MRNRHRPEDARAKLRPPSVGIEGPLMARHVFGDLFGAAKCSNLMCEVGARMKKAVAVPDTVMGPNGVDGSGGQAVRTRVRSCSHGQGTFTTSEEHCRGRPGLQQ